MEKKELVDLSEVVFYLRMGFSSVNENSEVADKITELQEAFAEVEKYFGQQAET